jgi:7,8-dihydropterin-6-yl-methyl-4-(beta-D-ribofuranosyl)aminobenzene 5'-phosphate synthase
MNRTIIVTTLVENSVHARGLRAEHGLAFHIQAGSHSLLFDTGQSSLVVENARKLGVPLERIEAIALSHGHNDHTGGLDAVRALASAARLFLHPAALPAKFAGNPDGTSRLIGMAEPTAAAIRNAAQAAVWTTKPTEVGEGIFVTGEIPRRTGFEDTGGRFYLDPAGERPDPLLDDQALFFEAKEGLVVLLGCGHAGVVNTLEYVRQLAGGRRIHTVLGGMHLLAASPERMAHTLDSFRRLDLQRLVPAHCTGSAAVAQLWNAFPGRCASCAVASTLSFQL